MEMRKLRRNTAIGKRDPSPDSRLSLRENWSGRQPVCRRKYNHATGDAAADEINP